MLEDALAQVLRPIRGVPFTVVIRAFTDSKVIPMDQGSPEDADLVSKLSEAARMVGVDLRARPITRPRPNEVGNDIEPHVLAALPQVGLVGSRPTSVSGAGQATGYPDILVTDAHRRHTYLEVKSYSAHTADSTMRSFYLSPSKRPKVSKDGRHLLIAFQMERVPIDGSVNSEYRAVEFKLVDLHDLVCDVKQEFWSDNHRIYSKVATLASGPI